MITDNLTTAVYFSDLLPKKCPTLNQHIAEVLEANRIPYAYLSETKDIWCRDFMPIQIAEDRFVSYKYTPDYLQDKPGLRLQTNPEAVLQAQQNRLTHVLQNAVKVDLILDGGNVVKCGNIVVMTEKVFAENRDKSPIEVDRILKDAFQCDVLYLPWDHQEAFGHSDGIVHFAGDGKVLITNYGDISPRYYSRFRVALEKHFEVIPLYYKTKKIHVRSWAYINFLQIGKLILVPQLGLEEDKQALEQISNAMPDCEVLGIPALEAVRRGGGLNCISWNTTTLQDDIFEESIIGQANIAQAPDAHELLECAECYELGIGCEPNLTKAAELYAEAAELGHDMAQFALALCYENGQGVEKDLAKAVEWYIKSAKQGNERAQYNLAICYEEGSGVERNMKKAVQWYKESAEQGFSPAQYNIAICYIEGNGTRKNLPKAVEWLKRAAKQGEALAQYRLAVCYRKGQGVKKDLVKAAQLYKKAAMQEDSLAQNDLGVCYEHGNGVKKDPKKAARWYKKAALQGEATAQFNYAVCCEKGVGVKPNLEKAEIWYTFAANQGYKSAKEKLKELQKKISASTIRFE